MSTSTSTSPSSIRWAQACAWLICLLASGAAHAEPCDLATQPTTNGPTIRFCAGVPVSLGAVDLSDHEATGRDALWLVDHRVFTADAVRFACDGTCAFEGVRDEHGAPAALRNGDPATAMTLGTPRARGGVSAAALGLRADAGLDLGAAALVPLASDTGSGAGADAALELQAHGGPWGASGSLALRDRERERIRLDLGALHGAPYGLLIANHRIRLGQGLSWIGDSDMSFGPNARGRNSRVPWVGRNARTGARDEFTTTGFSFATARAHGALLYRRERAAHAPGALSDHNPDRDGVDFDVSISERMGPLSALAEAASTLTTNHEALHTALGARMEWSLRGTWGPLTLIPRAEARGVGAARHGSSSAQATSGDQALALAAITPEVELLRTRQSRLALLGDIGWAGGFDARDADLVAHFFELSDPGLQLAGRLAFETIGAAAFRADWTVEHVDADHPLHRFAARISSASASAFLHIDGNLGDAFVSRVHSGVAMNVGPSTWAAGASHASPQTRTARFGAAPLRASDDRGAEGTAVFTDWSFVHGPARLSAELALSANTAQSGDESREAHRLGGSASADITFGSIALFATGGKLIHASEGFAFMGIRTSAAPSPRWLAGL